MKQLKSLKEKIKNFKLRGAVSKSVLLTLGIILILGGVYFFSVGNSGIEIRFEILSEGEIHPGDIFEAEVGVINHTNTSLENGILSIALPTGIKVLDAPQRVNEERKLDDIRTGGSAKEKLILVALPGEARENHELNIKLKYGRNSLSADFEENKRVKIDVRDIDFGLALEMPNPIFVSEKFETKVMYKNSETEGEHLERTLTLSGEQFEVVESDPDMVGDGWSMTDNGELVLQGRVNSSDKDVFTLSAKVVIRLGKDEIVLTEINKETIIAPSPLTLRVRLEDSPGYALPGETLVYIIDYKNNTDVNLKDATIALSLIGEIFNFNSVKTDGDFNSSTRTVTWHSGKFNVLKEVSTGEEGSFRVSISLQPKPIVNELSDRNLTLKAKGSIESPTVSERDGSDRTRSESTLETPVAGLVEVEASGLFRDAESGILNSGPFPPTVGKPTNYTIHWKISNYNSDLEAVEVRAKLESGVTFTGNVNSNVGVVPQFESDAGEVVWKIDSVRATAGVIGPGPEAVFQIEAIPFGELLGKYMPLLSITTISGRDIFAGADLLNTDGAITTRLTDDSTVKAEEGKVK